ncbi:MAG: gliding motility protein GldN [Chitinophagales bacterium]|nr:gliding motility protein GldN [Chitinophagales bacterium]
MKRNYFLLLAALFVSGLMNAQDLLDGVFEKITLKEKEILAYEHIREADVMWSKRIWRVIDIREKMNLPFKYPLKPLIDIIHTAAKNGDIQVYDPGVLRADEFKAPMTTKDVKNIGSRIDTTWTVDPITLKEVQTVTTQEFDPSKIVKYKIKEDWFFDEETSTMMVRIIGIAPVMESFDENGNARGDQTMYWVYYPDLRPIFAKYPVYNNKNDASTLSWEELFEVRYFTSYITKETNVHDRNIQEYATGLDLLYESERIKDELRNYEHDLWEF